MAGRTSFRVLPWPCAAVAAAHSEAADRGSSQRPGPPEVSGSHNKLCRGPPCTCAESAGNLLYPAGRGEEKGKKRLARSRVKREEEEEEGVRYKECAKTDLLPEEQD